MHLTARHIAGFEHHRTTASPSLPSNHRRRAFPREGGCIFAALDDLQPKDVSLDARSLESRVAAAGKFVSAFYRFTRPHTMLGTLVSVASVSLLAVGSQGIAGPATTALAQALSSALLMNICIVGINQVSA